MREREVPWTRPKPSRLPSSPATSAVTGCALREPVAVSSHGQITGYFIGPDEYEEFKRFRENRRSFATAELPEEKVEAIRSQMNKMRTLMLLKERQILSPDQRVKLNKLHEQWERDHKRPSPRDVK